MTTNQSILYICTHNAVVGRCQTLFNREQEVAVLGENKNQVALQYGRVYKTFTM